MLLAIMMFYAAYSGFRWIYDWQQGKLQANTFVWMFNCLMTSISFIGCIAIIFSTDINLMFTESGFGISVNLAYELKVKE
jgi:hypothetical protein